MYAVYVCLCVFVLLIKDLHIIFSLYAVGLVVTGDRAEGSDVIVPDIAKANKWCVDAFNTWKDKPLPRSIGLYM